MSETVTPGAADPAAIVSKCPHCGHRGTFKVLGRQFVEVSRVEVTTYACTRCGFRWVSLRSNLADETTKTIAVPPDPVKLQREKIRIAWERRLEVFGTDKPTAEAVADMAGSTERLVRKVLANIYGGES